MNNEQTQRISTRIIELPSGASASIRASRFRQTKSDCIIMFAVFTFFGLGLAGMVEYLVLPGASTIFSLGIAVATGSLAALGIAFANSVDWPLIRRDLDAGTCVAADVACNRAIAVGFQQNSLSGVALDCGPDTLVLIGNWWLNKNRSEIWKNAAMQKRFPADQFSMIFLPVSGKVLSIDVRGDCLDVNESEGSEVSLDLAFSKYAEVVHVDKPLNLLIAEVSADRSPS
jgi:hypothetical protein